MFLEGLVQVDALEDRVLCLSMQRARPINKLLKVVWLASFLAALASIDRCNSVIWPALLVRVVLVLVLA